MCSGTTPGAHNIIGLYWTDEELIMFLVRMSKGPPYPDGVLDYVNPYHYSPFNLPADFWFYIPRDQKDLEHGFWKAKGEPSEIFSNSSVSGSRTTLEFYEGRAPYAQKTNWVMQEYSILHKGLDVSKNHKGSNVLCRVFLTSETVENKNQPQNWNCAENAGANCLHLKPSVGSDSGNSLGLGVTQARSEGGNTWPSRIMGENIHPNSQVADLFEAECIAQGDYLGLDDLLNSGSQSFSSDNSSCVTISSDECFDSLELLKDLENDLFKGEEVQRANFKYNVATSAKPKEIVIQPVASGSLVGDNNENQSPKEAIDKRVCDKRVAENASGTQNEKSGSRSTSSSEDDEALASSSKSVPKGEKKRTGGRLKKLNKKYLCFMPFR